jgi:hypothetical protein
MPCECRRRTPGSRRSGGSRRRSSAPISASYRMEARCRPSQARLPPSMKKSSRSFLPHGVSVPNSPDPCFLYCISMRSCCSLKSKEQQLKHQFPPYAASLTGPNHHCRELISPDRAVVWQQTSSPSLH